MVRREIHEPPALWLRVGVAAAAVSAFLVTGQSPATATVSDSADTGTSAGASSDGAGSGDDSSQSGGAGQSSASDDQQQTANSAEADGDDADPGDADMDSGADAEAAPDGDAAAADEETGDDGSGTEGAAPDLAAEDEPAAEDAVAAAPTDSAAAMEDSTGSDADAGADADEHSDHTASSAQSDDTGRAVAVSTASTADTNAAAVAETASATDTGAVADAVTDTAATATDTDTVPVSTGVTAVADDTDTAAAVSSVAVTSSQASSAQQVTFKGIVTDVLTWIGLGPLANYLPVPDTPVPALIQSLWLAVREWQYVLDNQRPTADPTISAAGPDGVITGNLNATDYEGDTLTYTVTSDPAHGTVTVDADGNFVYTPNAATAAGGGVDEFTVTIEDADGNPWHVHGLLDLLGLSGAVTQTITVSVAATGVAATQISSLAALDLSGLETRNDLVIDTETDGSVSVIDGTFTDALVFSAADAVVVLNAAAELLGASDGFASLDEITVQTAGRDDGTDVVETYYRLSDTVDGLSVLGSEVILIVGENGAVTGLFSHFVELSSDIDLNPDVVVDEESEAQALASVAYLDELTATTPDQETLDSFLAAATFQDDLVVYALDSDAAPTLAWRVVVVSLATTDESGDESTFYAGATVYLYANGANAGQVILQVSSIDDASTTGTATDSLGQDRTITYRTTTWFFIFNSYYLIDDTRNITAYTTDYSFFGFGSPSLPGTVVQKAVFFGWDFGWNTAAVSAFANAEAVYDFYDTVLGRTSYDDNGATIKVSINYSPTSQFSSYYNAFWDSSIAQFVFGNGGNLGAAEDVVAHEFTHAVVSSILGASALSSGESGALNEAYADIMGVLIENKTGADRWLIGEDSTYPGGAIRNLADPSSITTAYGAYRETYADRYTGAGDDYGEHINSTIFSYAAYKMMTDPATSTITTDLWAEVFYRSLFRLSASSKFVDGRAAVISSARALGFTDAQLAAIAAAFDSVGIAGSSTSTTIAA